jgi:adenosine deaminase
VHDLKTLPKAHLHLHLEGGMRPTTLTELALEHGMEVPVVSGFGSFGAFAEMYLTACEVLRRPEDLVRLVDETADDAVAAGAVYVEPAIYLPHHRERLGEPEEVLELLLDASAAASRRTGVDIGWMVAADRTLDPADALEQARLAARHAGRGVVSFGLANDELLGPPGRFREAFGVARDAGLLSTPHAGELDGPHSVVAALELLGADRIQHGVRAVERAGLPERLADSGVCLDVCPTSNVLLAVVPSLADHPLPVLLDAGIRVSINADDPLLFGPGLLEEYELCRDAFALDDLALARIAATSIEASGACPNTKAEALNGIDEWLDAAVPSPGPGPGPR